MQPVPIFQDARFLIVDDEPRNVALLSQMLKRWNATHVLTTTDPRETLSLFQAHRPDVILLDLMMPHLDGFAVLEQLKPLIEVGEFLPILVLTADNALQTKRRALQAGASDFLTKPFDAIELSLRLQNLLDRRFLYRSLQSKNASLDHKVQQRTQQLAEAEIDTIECLAIAGEYRDDDTGHHTRRVGHMVAQMARVLRLSQDEVTLFERTAPLHDVGKIGVPDSILLKPGKLTPDEFEMIKTHTTIGAAIMARHHTDLLEQAAGIALTHHERWNGRGYPCGLAGENIPLEGRLVAVADVFDALTHERPYKKAWPVAEAVAEIQKQSGTQFDPAVVEAFSEVMRYGSGLSPSGFQAPGNTENAASGNAIPTKIIRENAMRLGAGALLPARP